MKRSLVGFSCWFLAPAAFAIIDANNNGVSDFWERDINNGSLFDETFDPQGDPDADGWTNAQEAAAGTSPFAPNPPDGLIRPDIAHVPAVIGEENGVPIVITPEAITVTWPTIAGKQYTLLFSPDLTQGSWLPVDSPFIAFGGVSEYGFYEVSTADKRFWRVAVEDIDSDSDGLADYEEHLFGTEYGYPETFGGILDAWLALHYATVNGFNPNGDSDSDGLSNFEEYLHGTNPKLADTDGDGVSDSAEVNQGSNPNDASDGGAAPADLQEEVAFTVGGDYASWRMEIQAKGPRDQRILRLASPNPGETETRNFKLHRNNRYEITLHRTDGVEGWYCWEAAVDAKPEAETFDEAEGYYQLGERNDLSHFFTVAGHWLVDNRQGLLTSHLHSYESDVASPLKAELVPVAIEDNIEATGVDIVSNSVAPDVPGYRDKLWIMAPIAGPPPPADYSDEMKFDIPLNPAAELEIECDHATPDPATVTLDGGKPTVAWRGSGANETNENTTTFEVGEHNDEVDLPIGVMTMKHRVVRVHIYRVAKLIDGGNPLPPYYEMVPTAEELKNYLNPLFAYQINSWFDVVLEDQIPEVNYGTTFEYDPTGQGHSPDQQAAIDAFDGLNENADLHVFIIGTSAYLGGDAKGVTSPAQATCWITGRAFGDYDSKQDVLETIGHEVGHVFFGAGHPDEADPVDRGVAPLTGTDHSKRLMCKNPVSNSKLVVKGEWDKAEDWLSKRPNGDN